MNRSLGMGEADRHYRGRIGPAGELTIPVAKWAVPGFFSDFWSGVERDDLADELAVARRGPA